jgi:hypothetical protein
MMDFPKIKKKTDKQWPQNNLVLRENKNSSTNFTILIIGLFVIPFLFIAILQLI